MQSLETSDVHESISSGKVVIMSFVVDVLDVVSNLIVAVITGSATVFSEMAQGIADRMGSVLLGVGERRSRRTLRLGAVCHQGKGSQVLT